MRIVLDLTKLVEEGALTSEQAGKLKTLAAKETGSLGINIILAFGVIAIAGGILALVASGLLVLQFKAKQWGLLGAANLMVGALTLSGGLIVLWNGDVVAFSLTALILLIVGVLARSGFLIAISPLALAAVLGSSTGYSHASWQLSG